MSNLSTASTILPIVGTNVILLGNQTTKGSNGTGEGGHSYMDLSAAEYVTFLFCILVIVVGVSGNSVVIMCFASRSRKLKTAEIFVIGLAFADLLGTISTPVQKMMGALHISMLPIGDFGCGFIFWVGMTSVTVSAFLLVAISFDRYLLIIRPFEPKLPKRKAIIVTVMLWVTASSLGIVYFIDQRSSFHKVVQGHWICANYWMTHNERVIHTVAAFLIQMLFPCLLSTVVSVLSVKELSFQRQCSLSDQNAQASASIMARNGRAIRWIITAVVSFFVLVLPYNIFMLHYTVSKSKITPTIVHIHDMLALILLLNSCVNPIIYARLNHTYRRSLRRASYWFIGKLNQRRATTATLITDDGSAPFAQTTF